MHNECVILLTLDKIRLQFIKRFLIYEIWVDLKTILYNISYRHLHTYFIYIPILENSGVQKNDIINCHITVF